MQVKAKQPLFKLVVSSMCLCGHAKLLLPQATVLVLKQ